MTLPTSRHNESAADRWRRVIAAHFFINYPYDGSPPTLTDHYLYLVMRLFNLSPSEAVSLMLDVGVREIPVGMRTHDPLLDWARRRYEDATGRETAQVSVHKTMEHTSFRAFCQTLQDRSNFVDIWNGASALCCLVSMVIAQHEAATLHLFSPSPSPHAEPKLAARRHQQLLQGLASLDAWVAAWRRHGFITIDRDSHFTLDDVVMDYARSLFVDALFFILYHELAHHFLGHLSSNAARKPAPDEYRQQELEADSDALRWLSAVSGRELTLAPMVVFLAASLASDEDDATGSDSHPSLVARVNHYFGSLISAAKDRAYAEKWVRGYAIPKLRTLIGNLHDRDRMPAWFGISREELTQSLQAQGRVTQDKVQLQRSEVEPNLLLRYFDRSRPVPASKRRTLDLI